MIKKHKVKQNLYVKTISERLVYGDAVVEAIETAEGGNLFKPIADKISAAQKKLKDLEKAKLKKDEAEAKLKAATSTQLEMQKSFDLVFRSLARGVDEIAKGDKAIIDKAAMDSYLSGKNPAIGKLSIVENLSLAAGKNEGELIGKWKGVKGALSYLVHISFNTPDNWEYAGVSTNRKIILKKLGSGKQIWARVAAIGTAGQGAWSDPATKFTP